MGRIEKLRKQREHAESCYRLARSLIDGESPEPQEIEGACRRGLEAYAVARIQDPNPRINMLVWLVDALKIQHKPILPELEAHKSLVFHGDGSTCTSQLLCDYLRACPDVTHKDYEAHEAEVAWKDFGAVYLAGWMVRLIDEGPRTAARALSLGRRALREMREDRADLEARILSLMDDAREVMGIETDGRALRVKVPEVGGGGMDRNMFGWLSTPSVELDRQRLTSLVRAACGASHLTFPWACLDEALADPVVRAPDSDRNTVVRYLWERSGKPHPPCLGDVYTTIFRMRAVHRLCMPLCGMVEGEMRAYRAYYCALIMTTAMMWADGDEDAETLEAVRIYEANVFS